VDGWAARALAARRLADGRRYPEALRLLEGCLASRATDRSAARAECLIEGQRTVDLAYAYYRQRERYLHDLASYGAYPGGRDSHGNDKTFIKTRARRLAAELQDLPCYEGLARLDGAALAEGAKAQMAEQSRLVSGLRLHQAEDPDRGPIRTYRFASALIGQLPGSPHAAEAAFRLLSEREELRLVTQGNREHPWFGLERRRDLEGFLGRFPRGPFADRARLELAAILYDLWLLSAPALQATDDYRGYLKVGGAPLDAKTGAGLRLDAIGLYASSLSRLEQVRSTYRPGEDPRWAIERARRQALDLRRGTQPADAFPSTLFPPG
jgi:hypothetical protein